MGNSFQSKFNKFRMNQDISILFENLTSVETPPTHGWVYGWLGGLMGGVR